VVNVKLLLGLIKYLAMKTDEEVEAWLRVYFTSALERGEWSVVWSSRCNPGGKEFLVATEQESG
jgi:hypothetical protein